MVNYIREYDKALHGPWPYAERKEKTTQARQRLIKAIQSNKYQGTLTDRANAWLKLWTKLSLNPVDASLMAELAATESAMIRAVVRES